ncbi:MAG: PAS domain S-box protein, partial [Acidobacteria bacterium]
MQSFERRRRLVWFIAIRAIISTLLLGAGLIVQINSPGAVPVRAFYLLISLSYALTLVNALTLRWTDRHRWLVNAHLVSDVVIVSGFIAVTGGVASYFALLYVLPIIAASTVEGRRGSLTIGGLSSLVYAALVAGQYRMPMESVTSAFGQGAVLLPSARVALYTVAINIFAFLAVAALSGSLAESLRVVGVSLARASKEIEDLQAFSQDIIDSLISGLLTTDVNGRILTFNAAAEQISGHSSAKVIHRDVAEVLQWPAVKEALATDLGGQRSWRADFVYHTGDGRTIDLGLAVAHLLTPGGKAGFLITFQDVTEIKRLERDGRVRQRLAAVGEMAAGIAHEIRNPLASMAGSMQVLRDELPLNAEQAELMDIVLRESTRLNETIRSFLAYARPQRTAVATLDLAKIVRDAATLLRNSADVKPEHRVEVETPPDPLLYEADEGQIRQILWNLATNGLRAMAAGGRLRLAAFSSPKPAAPPCPGHEQDRPPVVLEVEDEGVGIPAEELDGIFQP